MSRFFTRTLFAAALAAMLPAPGLAGAAFDPEAPIPTGPELKVGKLSNGLTYYIRRNREPARRLELRLVVKAGSILDDVKQAARRYFDTGNYVQVVLNPLTAR